MLQTQTVEPGTLSLLKELQDLKVFEDFFLVGGTALSLLYGHRTSIDIDLFTNRRFDPKVIQTFLKSKYQNNFEYEKDFSAIGVFGYIKGIKVDFVKYLHPILKPIQIIDGIRFISPEDIAAMKMQAILGRGKKKDFWDIVELLNHFTIAEMMAFHKEKFPNQLLAISIPQVLTYFEDAEESEDPVSIKGQTWESIKHNLRVAVSEFLK